MLGCRFSFEVYAKNVQEKANKCSLKTTEVLLNADGQFLRATQTLHVLFFLFSKKNLSRAGSELHRVRRNIVSAEESVRG